MQTVFYNGQIITMEKKGETVQAVLTENGMIIKAGSLDEIKETAQKECCYRNLKGRTMMPGFIDSHSHFISYGDSLLQADLNGAESIQEISRRIRAFIREQKIRPGEWVRARGFDHNFLQGRRSPVLCELDAMSPEHPLVIQHQSGHGGFLNSKALELLEITEEIPEKYKGMTGTDDNGLTGYLEETAFLDAIKKIPMPSEIQLLEAMKKAQEIYLSFGVTTMQEGMIVGPMVPVLKNAVDKGFLKLDYVGYLDNFDREKIVSDCREYMGDYKNHFRIGGYKIFLDGSPQSKTAWVSKAYEGTDYRGYPILTDETVTKVCKKAIKEKTQILAHCNGDMACEQFIEAYRSALKDAVPEEKEDRDIRPVIVHGQLMTGKQLKEAKELGMIPSFFVSHVYYWGDVHLENLGCKRAKEISPLKEAADLNIPFSIHSDAPVTEPRQLEAVWCAVNRITKKGVPLGVKQCVDVYDGLKAITINAAYQYHEENRKGSIAPGKNADFVILDKNPLKVDKNSIRDIRVLETIKEGITIFKL